MTDEQDLGAIARAIIDANLYMVLGTADAAGRPWVSPVYYAPAAYTEFSWVSSPEATHSHNLVTRPDVSIVIFDSQVPIGTGQGVYIKAVAEELTSPDDERGIDVFSRRSEEHGGPDWKLENVQAHARHRLYRAIASEYSVLGARDHRVRVTV